MSRVVVVVLLAVHRCHRVAFVRVSNRGVQAEVEGADCRSFLPPTKPRQLPEVGRRDNMTESFLRLQYFSNLELMALNYMLRTADEVRYLYICICLLVHTEMRAVCLYSELADGYLSLLLWRLDIVKLDVALTDIGVAHCCWCCLRSGCCCCYRRSCLCCRLCVKCQWYGTCWAVCDFVDVLCSHDIA